MRSLQTARAVHDLWFKPAFEIIDKAVFGGERVLVHCAEGKSRSVALVVAYLMQRFQVSYDDAAAFVKARRPCADTKFAPELRLYEQHLREARTALATPLVAAVAT